MSVKFTFKKFEPQDATALYEALKDSRVVNHMASDGITTDTCKTIVLEAQQHWVDHGIGSYAVVDPLTGQILGWAGFKHLTNKEYEILVVLGPESWGIGFDIYDELLTQARDLFKLKEVFVVLPDTRKTFRWIQKKGFEYVSDTVYNGEQFKKFVMKIR